MWRDVLAELARRGVLRSTGGPVGDYAESLVARAFSLQRASYPTPGWDARASSGETYSVKARRWGRTTRPTRVRLGDIAAHPFDRLVFVLLSDDMLVLEAVELPYAAAAAIALGAGEATYTTVGRILGSAAAVDRRAVLADALEGIADAGGGARPVAGTAKGGLRDLDW